MYARQFYHVSRPQLHSHVDWPLLAENGTWMNDRFWPIAAHWERLQLASIRLSLCSLKLNATRNTLRFYDLSIISYTSSNRGVNY